jgi:5-methylcytosine-specific restriction enzyme B
MDLADVMKGSYRLWTLPILRALDKLGGKAPPREIEGAIRELAPDALTELQWARVIKGKYVRWAGMGLKKAGLLGGTGSWELNASGRAFIENHASAPLEFPKITPLDAQEAGKLHAPLETVPATDFAAYEIPILRVLADGARPKQDLVSRVESDLQGTLLAGDSRTMNSGERVIRYRVSWALTNLKKAGEIRNPTIGTWEITEAGRARLEKEGAAWMITTFQDSKVQVRAEWTNGASTAPSSKVPSVPPPPVWPTKAWKELAERFDDALLAPFAARVRPDLGATPPPERTLPRNVIFYGPPGTGKTYVARSIARALTGEHDPAPDGPWSLVQFHPSYAYEDFIQGLRPNLEHPELRYQIRKGPFLQICDAAAKEPDRFFVLVVDEINRGDPARIFGELLYALEYRGDPVDLPLGGQLLVPPNLIVIGTMNSVDRSVALVDYALRRRFSFVRVDPDPEAIRNADVEDTAGATFAADVLETFNGWLVDKLGREHAIGHSFFLSPAVTALDASGLERIWHHDIHPLLEEYFFGQVELLKEARQQWAAAIADASAEGDEETPGA